MKQKTKHNKHTIKTEHRSQNITKKQTQTYKKTKKTVYTVKRECTQQIKTRKTWVERKNITKNDGTMAN